MKKNGCSITGNMGLNQNRQENKKMLKKRRRLRIVIKIHLKKSGM